MVKLRATFDNKDEALFPNQFVNIRLLVDVLKGVVVAPTAAIQHGAPGDYAYVVGPDGKASVRVLKIGQIDGDRAQVLSGLNAGDRVVVDGADRLREGADVRVVGDSSTEPAASSNAAPTPALDPAQGGAVAAPADPAQDPSHRRRRQRDGAASPNGQDGGQSGQSGAAK
jgi:multidrug efflux system membrane fusion protein